jgi:hypothetical protein
MSDAIFIKKDGFKEKGMSYSDNMYVLVNPWEIFDTSEFDEFISIEKYTNLQSQLEAKTKEIELLTADLEWEREVKAVHLSYLKAEKAKVKYYEEALRQLGHFGIDFGYGAYECDVAKIAQEALEKHKQEKGE